MVYTTQMTTLTVMVGLSGSGKSVYAKNLVAGTSAILIESDEYRQRLYGDAAIQGDNQKLFQAINRDVVSNLQSGHDVVFDATNLSYKFRIQLLQQVKKLNVRCVAIVMATQFSICLERNANRSRVVPEHVLYRMRESFTCPQLYEGFDEISFVYNYESKDYDYEKFMDYALTFNQDNHYHAYTLGEHINNVVNRVKSEYSFALLWAAKLHDVGKIYTKKFQDSKGEPSEMAHYYGHEGCSAYEAMFFLDMTTEEFPWVTRSDIVYIVGLIQNHMRLHQITTDKAKDKLMNLVGEAMYSDLEKLNEADTEGK